VVAAAPFAVPGAAACEAVSVRRGLHAAADISSLFGAAAAPCRPANKKGAKKRRTEGTVAAEAPTTPNAEETTPPLSRQLIATVARRAPRRPTAAAATPDGKEPRSGATTRPTTPGTVPRAVRAAPFAVPDAATCAVVSVRRGLHVAADISSLFGAAAH
jgi:hypothetical protein